MPARRRYGRPNRPDLLVMMLVNALVSAPVLWLMCLVFHVQPIILNALPRYGPSGLTLAHALAEHGLASLVLPLIPGAAIGNACLWYWLILTGRTRGVSWGGAIVYGMIVALANVPVGGAVAGTLGGSPLLGLLLGLIFLLLLPALTLAMAVSGVLLGLFNANLAQEWLRRYRRV